MQEKSQEALLQELETRVAALLTNFRELDRSLPPDQDKQALQSFFRELFSLSSFLQKAKPQPSLKAPESSERERHFEWLYKSGLILHGSHNGEELLELALDTLLEMVHCQRGFIAKVNDAGQFTFFAARNFHKQTIPEPEQEVSRSVVTRAWELKREVQVHKTDDFGQSMMQKSSIIRREGGALLCIPVIWDDAVVAVIYLDQFQHPLSMATASLVRNFAMQLGAFLKQAHAFTQLRSGSEQLLDQLKNQFRFDRIIGKNKEMVQVLKQVSKVATTDASILIEGETGTGKDLIARAVHENSHRAGNAYIEVDCGALAENLVESELFGHVKGAFTGAADEKQGLLMAAHGGTLFLDEINNLPLAIQTKLLRVLQQRKVRRLGDSRERAVDFRLIAASSKSLKDMVKAENFRQDLLYRINTISLTLPPLRERRDDVLLLAQVFLEKFSKIYGKGSLRLHADALRILETYNWPGNVRELEHVVERAVILAEGTQLSPADFPIAGAVPELIPEDASLSLEAYLLRAKKHYITQVLKENDGKKVDAAKQLQINRSHLFQLIKQLDIGSES